MRARIPGRQRVVNRDARYRIREMQKKCAAQTLIEVFGFGGSGKRLRSIEESVETILSEHDRLYTDSRAKVEGLLCFAKTVGLDYKARPGSGAKVVAGLEHDVVLLAYLIELHRKEHFGYVRLDRFHTELCRRIRYYKATFDSTPGVLLDVMTDRLVRYGKTD